MNIFDAKWFGYLPPYSCQMGRHRLPNPSSQYPNFHDLGQLILYTMKVWTPQPNWGQFILLSPLLLLVSLVLPGVAFTQLLDFNSRKVVSLDNGQELVLFQDISDKGAYYYLPGPANIGLVKNKEGNPAFLFLRYTQDQVDQTEGALWHMVLELNVAEVDLQAATRILAEQNPDARIVGPAVAKSSGVKLISGTEDSATRVISTSRAPTLTGGRFAIAMRLEAAESQLLTAAFDQNSSSISIVLSYTLNFGVLENGKLSSTFRKDYDIVVDPNNWYQELRRNPKAVRSVNLNDPFFQHQEVKFILDFESVELFDSFINYVEVSVKKERKGAYDFLNSLLIDKNYLTSSGKLASVTYAKGNNPSPEYQYRLSWSLRGGKIYPSNPSWLSSNFPVVTLAAPFRSLDTEVETDYANLAPLKIRRVAVEFRGKLANQDHSDFLWFFTTSSGIPKTDKHLYFDINSLIEFRVHWIHADKGKIVTDWQLVTDDYLWLDIPDDLKLPAPDNSMASNTRTASDQVPALNATYAHSNYALLFAVDEYLQKESYSALMNPIKDAGQLAQELSDNYGFQVELVKNPDRATMRDKISEYHQKFQNGTYNSNGQLLLFFSGHGDYEEISKNGCFLPTDARMEDLGATAFQYSYWRPRIDNLPCKHILVVVDACYSGTFDNAIAMRSGKAFSRPNELSSTERFLQDFQDRKSRLYLVSGGKEKTPDQSMFLKKILEGLRVNQEKSLLTIGQLYENSVRKIRPLPLIGEFGSDEAGSSFIFIKK